MRIFNLSNKSGSLTSSDKFVLDNGTNVMKIDYNALAKAIIEQYTGSTLAGSAQSVKAALDALNSNKAASNTFSLAACQTLKTNWGSYPSGFSTATLTSGGPVYMAMIYKVNAEYGCAILMTYGSDQQTTPIFIQMRQSTWSAPISLR